MLKWFVYYMGYSKLSKLVIIQKVKLLRTELGRWMVGVILPDASSQFLGFPSLDIHNLLPGGE